MTTLKDKIRDVVNEYEADTEHGRDSEALTTAICDEIEEYLRKVLGN